jgi:rhomboid family GlyGly-CTERM serine protease
MGLRQGDSEQRASRAKAAWTAAAMVGIVAIVIGLLGDTGRDWLAYERSAIADGEYWRLLSAHFAHLGGSHLLLNLAGLLLITYLVGAELSAGEWGVVLVLACLAVSIGLWVLLPDLEGYVGLSGVLHGLLAAGLLASAGRWGIDLWIVAVALVAKLAYEQWVGPLPSSEGLSGGNVIVDAHLYGAVSGCITGASAVIRVRAQAAI